MTGLAKVGDRIEHGQPIPGNVVQMTDVDGDDWARDTEPDRWRCEKTTLRDRTSVWALAQYGPMTVVEVDPEPQPASAAILVVGDDIEWGQGIPAHVIRMVGGSLNGRPDSDPVDLCLITETGNGDVTWWSAGGDENWSDEDIPQECYPLRVTRVRESQPAEPCPGGCGIDLGHPGNPDRQCACIKRAEPQPTEARRQGWPYGSGPGGYHMPGDYPQPADPSQPVVLRLDDEPVGAVAVVGVKSGTRWERTPVNGGRWQNVATLIVRDWTGVLEREREVTVEFAPPREPRTWEQITDDTPAGELPSIVRVTRATGPEIWALDRNGVYFRKGDGVGLTLVELRTLGEVREVLS